MNNLDNPFIAFICGSVEQTVIIPAKVLFKVLPDISRATSGTRGTGSTSSLREAIARLNRNSKKLDAISRNKFRGNPAKLGAWLRADHLERDPKPQKPDAQTN